MVGFDERELTSRQGGKPAAIALLRGAAISYLISCHIMCVRKTACSPGYEAAPPFQDASCAELQKCTLMRQLPWLEMASLIWRRSRSQAVQMCSLGETTYCQGEFLLFKGCTAFLVMLSQAC